MRPRAEVSGHAPQAAFAAPSGFQPAAARLSALTSRKWLPRMDSRHQPPGSEPGALAVELQGKTSANRSCTGLSPIPAACVATNALAEFEMVGHLGAAPSVCCSGSYAVTAPRFVGRRYRATRSPIRTARIAVFLVPDEVVEPRGIAPRSTQCHCVVLLLDDGPEMERAPGLAPSKSGFAIRRLDGFGIARF